MKKITVRLLLVAIPAILGLSLLPPINDPYKALILFVVLTLAAAGFVGVSLFMAFMAPYIRRH